MSTNSPNPRIPRSTVVALFANRGDADQGITRLLNVGVAPDQIGLLEPADEPKNPALGGTLRMAAGAVLGAIIGGATGTFVIGFSSIIWAIVAATTGIAFGGYGGALIASFFTDDGGADEPYFVRAIEDGRILVSVEVPERVGESMAAAVLHEARAVEVNSIGTGRLRLHLRHPLEEAA